MMTKTVIAPIIGFLVLAVQLIFHVDIPKDVVSQVTDTIVNVASLILVVYGIFKNHKKEETQK